MDLEALRKRHERGQKKLNKFFKMSPEKLLKKLNENETIINHRAYENDMKYTLDIENNPSIIREDRYCKESKKYEPNALSIGIYCSVTITSGGIAYKPEHGGEEYILKF